MKSAFKFSNLLGTVYRQGNLLFTEDGSKLLSPVGNRISCFDLINNKSFTFAYEHRKNIVCVALNKQGNLMLSVDEDGRAILINFISRTVLHHFNFKDTVLDLQFSPDGQHFAITCLRFIQVWKTPDFSEDRQFAPFVRHRVYAGHFSDVTSLSWLSDSRFFVSTSRDMTSRIFSLHAEDKEAAMTLAGHRDEVVKAFFNDTQEIIYTLSRDGALLQWEYTKKLGEEMDDDKEDDTDDGLSWRITAKNFFHLNAKVECATFHASLNMLVVGFDNGEFRLYELPEFTMIQQLSMGQNAVDTVLINKTGEWLAFGSSEAGQLLVYEWKSELYILKQQGHFDALNTLCYLPDGLRIVTGTDDGKLKIWDAVSGFCLMTFTEHTGAVMAVQFAKRGQVMFSASVDGTVRAWDLIRYRNFRTFTSAERVQYTTLAVDPSGEVVVAGARDSFEIYVWLVQTAQLLDTLTGHEGPILCLSIGAESSILASASWDRTVRIWNIFGRLTIVEPIEVSLDVLGLSLRPDAQEWAVCTLDGYITAYNVELGQQTHMIDGRKDIIGGRHKHDRFTSKNSARSSHFTTLDYSFDGKVLVAAGEHNSVCMYDVSNEVLLKRFMVSSNMQVDGTLQKLNSKLDDGSGPGQGLPEDSDASVRVMSIKFLPTSAAFAAASTEGVLVYGIDQGVVFDPFDLDADTTVELVVESLSEGEFLTALVMSFRLGEFALVQRTMELIPARDVALITRDIPQIYVERLLRFIGEELLGRRELPHIEHNLFWVQKILLAHGQYIMSRPHEFRGALRTVQRYLQRVAKDIVRAGRRNDHAMYYLEIAKYSDQDSKESETNIAEIDYDDAEMSFDEEIAQKSLKGRKKSLAKLNFKSESEDEEM